MKEEILSYILHNTQKNHSSSLLEISDAIKKGRNVTAKAIKELYDQGYLICIEGNKRSYYHKKTLEEMYHQTLTQKNFMNESLMWNTLKKEELKDFENLIGYKDSLANCVEMCKAAISYPQNSLPILLNGATGTGKSYMAQLMYDYACNTNIIDSSKPFVTLNCSEYANNPELLTAHLFGHKKGAFTGADNDNLGLIQVADGGVLFLDEVHCLKAECQEKLFLFMDKGIYHRVGENEKWESSHVRLIFATTEIPEKVLLKTFLRRIPIIVNIPALNERGIYERIALLHAVFMQEEKRIQKPIYISNLVYNAFLSYQFEGNIGELKNTVQVCCAHALHQNKRECMEIHMEDLPNKMFDQKKYGHKLGYDIDDRMIAVSQLSQEGQKESLLLELYNALLSLSDENHSFLNNCLNVLQEYYNKISYDNKNTKSNKNEFIFENINHIVRSMFQKYGGKINNNDVISLFNYIEDERKQPVNVRTWHKAREQEIVDFHKRLTKVLTKEIVIAEEIMIKINRQLDMDFDAFSIDVMALNIRLFNRNVELKKRIGIILAHGYSTASSIADAANQLLEDYVFDSIDMAVDMSSDKVVDELNMYLKSNNNFDELVLLVDMGSLEDIDKGIDSEINANIGIINNITTKLALEIGNNLRNNVPLQTLLQEACEHNTFHYRMIEKKQKEDVIVCVCASGLGTAEKLRTLLLSSLPSDLKIHIITYDYNVLIAQKEKCELFEKYNVLCIIGTLDPLISSTVFIPIEELIIEQDIEKMEQLLKKYMAKEEIDKFKQEILKNFSLSNVMNFLTILNPQMLLEHVASALDLFQKMYEIRICNKTCVGLYVHVCCMIERLVMRQPLDNYVNIDYLQQTEQRFIQCIKKAFEETQAYYGIQIPDHEIGYLYEYIQNGVEEDNDW